MPWAPGRKRESGWDPGVGVSILNIVGEPMGLAGGWTQGVGRGHGRRRIWTESREKGGCRLRGGAGGSKEGEEKQVARKGLF